MPPAPSQRRSNVRRANVTACMRCKSRKQRCDQNIPACLNCEAAGVECVNVDINGQVTPRSYIRNLEDRVAHLEKQLICRGITDYDTVPGDDELEGAGAGPETTSPQSTNHTGHAAASQVSPEPLQPARIPALLIGPLNHLATANLPIHQGGEYQGLLEGLPYDPQTALPSREAASVLMDAYFEHSEFSSPILMRQDMDDALGKLYHAGRHGGGSADESIPSIQARFRITLVFAIAARLSTCKESSFPTSRAEAYYASATRALSATPELIQKPGLDQLVNLVLVLQYLLFSSNLVSSWYLLGFATRMALEMGIHCEDNSQGSVDENEMNDSVPRSCAHDDLVERRRWIFWAVYSFERILCHVLNRPCSIPDESITTLLPSVTQEEEAGSRRCFAIHLIKHRRLSSEIEQTIAQKRSVNGAILSFAAWRDGIWHRLQEWRATVPQVGRPSQLAPAEIFDGCYHNSMIRLYLPSPHMPEPNEFEYAFLARSAIEAVDNYKTSFKEGKLRFYWRTLHHLFRAGTALVQCLKKSLASAPVLESDPTQAELKISINTCSAVLWGMVERYHLGRAYRDTFDNISSAIVNDTGSFSDQQTRVPSDPFAGIYVPPDEFGFTNFV